MKTEKISFVSRLIDGISSIFMPIVNILSAAGVIKGITLILLNTGVLAEGEGSYIVLNAIGDSLFYFLPLILAVTAAKRFGTNPYIAMVVAGALLYPSLVAAMADSQTVSFFGLPLRSTTYSSTAIPIIAACALLSVLERFLDKHIPDVIKGFSVPMIMIFSVSLITLFVFGPIGALIGDGLAIGYDFIYNLSPVVAGAILGATIQLMVLVGAHWSFILIAMNNLLLNGSDTILALIAPAIFAQAGAGLAVLLKTKGNGKEAKAFRSTCVTAIISAILGVTEPVMYGVNLPNKKPMIAVCTFAGIGGGLVGFFGCSAKAFAFPSLASFPIYFGAGFVMLALSCGIAFLGAFIMTLFMRFDVKIASNDRTGE